MTLEHREETLAAELAEAEAESLRIARQIGGIKVAIESGELDGWQPETLACLRAELASRQTRRDELLARIGEVYFQELEIKDAIKRVSDN